MKITIVNPRHPTKKDRLDEEYDERNDRNDDVDLDDAEDQDGQGARFQAASLIGEEGAGVVAISEEQEPLNDIVVEGETIGELMRDLVQKLRLYDPTDSENTSIRNQLIQQLKSAHERGELAKMFSTVGTAGFIPGDVASFVMIFQENAEMMEILKEIILSDFSRIVASDDPFRAINYLSRLKKPGTDEPLFDKDELTEKTLALFRESEQASSSTSPPITLKFTARIAFANALDLFTQEQKEKMMDFFARHFGEYCHTWGSDTSTGAALLFLGFCPGKSSTWSVKQREFHDKLSAFVGANLEKLVTKDFDKKNLCRVLQEQRPDQETPPDQGTLPPLVSKIMEYKIPSSRSAAAAVARHGFMAAASSSSRAAAAPTSATNSPSASPRQTLP